MKKLLILSLLIVGMVFATAEFGSIEVVSPTDHGTMNPDDLGAEAYFSYDGGDYWNSSSSYFGTAYECFWKLRIPMSPPWDEEYAIDVTYSYNFLTNGLYCDGSYYYAANDFVGEGGHYQELTLWVIVVEPASSIELMFYTGDDSGPNYLLDSEEHSFILTDTGDDKWGYDIYKCFIPGPIHVNLSYEQYWMTINPTGGIFYWLCGDKDTVTIEETTWGQIKGMEL